MVGVDSSEGWWLMGKGGYCNCTECKADQARRSRKVLTGRRKGEPAPERPDMGEGFWERVRETSAVRDAVKRQRR